VVYGAYHRNGQLRETFRSPAAILLLIVITIVVKHVITTSIITQHVITITIIIKHEGLKDCFTSPTSCKTHSLSTTFCL
jgi:hypothetical protein